MLIMVYGADVSREARPDELVNLLEQSHLAFWVDVPGPTDDDLKVMREIFRFHPLAIEDTHNEKQRPKIEEYTDHAFLILNTVSLQGNDLVFDELDVFVGGNYVVTVHADEEPAIEETLRKLDKSHPTLPMSASYMLYVLLDVVIDDYFPVLDTFTGRLEEFEDRILTSPNEDVLQDLYQLKRMTLEMWRVLWPQREIMNALILHDHSFVDQETLQFHLRDVNDHLMWISDMVNNLRDTLTGLVNLYMSSVSNRINRVVNRLTVFAIVVGLLTVISGFYGMNFARTWPPFSSQWGVVFVVTVMTLITGVILVVLRRLDWL